MPLSLVNRHLESRDEEFIIKPATKKDAALIFSLMKELAEYQNLSLGNDEELIRIHLFSEHSIVNVIIGYFKNVLVCYSIFFCNYSCFALGHGIYLENI